MMYPNQRRVQTSLNYHDFRLRFVSIIIVIFACVIIAKLFILMILQYDFYTALAAGSQEIYAQLFPRRGGIWLTDSRTGAEFAAAINKDVYLMYADTRVIPDNETAQKVVDALAPN